jgi:hypothetical protein
MDMYERRACAVGRPMAWAARVSPSFIVLVFALTASYGHNIGMASFTGRHRMGGLSASPSGPS